MDTLKGLLTKQPGLVHARDADGYTPLHRASYSNHTTTISYLLSVGANVSTKTELGWTPLHSACNWNNYNAVARLLAAGADPNSSSDGGTVWDLYSFVFIIYQSNADNRQRRISILHQNVFTFPLHCKQNKKLDRSRVCHYLIDINL